MVDRDILRRSLTDWLLDMELIQAGNAGAVERCIGCYEPYATSRVQDPDGNILAIVGP